MKLEIRLEVRGRQRCDKVREVSITNVVCVYKAKRLTLTISNVLTFLFTGSHPSLSLAAP